MLAIDVEANVGELALRVRLPAASGTTIVVGPNGAGKTTLLLAVLGIVKGLRGEISLGGERLFSDRERVRVDVPIDRRRLGYVPQRYALFPHMTVERNVGFGVRHCTDDERRARVASLLADLGIDHLAGRTTSSLSGGEAQRVALARALAIRPRALLLDEPTAALDAGARTKVRRFLADRLAAIDIPTLVVSHDVSEVSEFAGRVAVLEAGCIVQIGTLDEVRSAPATPFVQELFASEISPTEGR